MRLIPKDLGIRKRRRNILSLIEMMCCSFPLFKKKKDSKLRAVSSWREENVYLLKRLRRKKSLEVICMKYESSQKMAFHLVKFTMSKVKVSPSTSNT